MTNQGPPATQEAKRWALASILVHLALFGLTLTIVFVSLISNAGPFLDKTYSVIADEQARSMFKFTFWVVFVLLGLSIMVYFLKFYISLVLFDESEQFRKRFLDKLGFKSKLAEVILRSIGFLFLLTGIKYTAQEKILVDTPIFKFLLDPIGKSIVRHHDPPTEFLKYYSFATFMAFFFAIWLVWDLVLLLNTNEKLLVFKKYLSVHGAGFILWIVWSILAVQIPLRPGLSNILLLVVSALVVFQGWYTLADLFKRRDDLPGQLREFCNVVKDNARYLRA